ncbi:MAG: alpha/beta hydrolase family esterase [Thiotrichales bacterium]
MDPPPGLGCAAILVVLHGTLQRGALAQRITGLADPAVAGAAKVFFPDALGGYWRDGLRPDDAIDDVHFLAELVRHATGETGCAGKPVFLVGVSNGGFMVQRLLCEYPELFAAAGVVIATMGLDLHLRCYPRSAVSLCLVAGTADPIVPHAGGSMRLRAAGGFAATQAPVLSFGETVEHWRRLGGLELQIRETHPIDDGQFALREDRYGAGAGTQLWALEVVGGGHHWFGYPIDPVYERHFGPTTRGFATTRYLWTFFRALMRS